MVFNSKLILFFSSGFLLVLFLIILLISFSLKQYEILQGKVQVVEAEKHEKNEALSTYAQNSYKQTLILLKMYKTSEPQKLNDLFNQFHALAHAVTKANNNYLAIKLSDNEKEVHEQIVQLMKETVTIRNQIASFIIDGNKNDALNMMLDDSIISQEKVIIIIEKLQAIQNVQYNQDLEKIRLQQKDNILRISALGLALFIIFSILVFFTLRYILRKENIVVRRAEVTLDSISHGVITTDTSGKVDYINPFAMIVLEAVGCAPIDKHFDELGIIYKKGETTPISNIVSNAVNDPNIIQHYNQCYIKKDDVNVFFWVAVTITSIIGKNNEFMGVIIIFTDISEVNSLNEKLKFEASHDSLTGLYSRRVVEEKIEHAVLNSVNERSSSILFYIDLDNFKSVNDTAGHPAGDRLLVEISSLLKKHVREYDIVGRIGGDEFVILMYRCTEKQAEEIARKIIASVNSYRLNWEGKEYSVGSSIGLTCINCHKNDTHKNSNNNGNVDNDIVNNNIVNNNIANKLTVEQVTKNADKALYEAKSAGKNCYRII